MTGTPTPIAVEPHGNRLPTPAAANILLRQFEGTEWDRDIFSPAPSPRKAIPEILNSRVSLVEQVSPKTCDAVAARRGRRRLVTKGTSHLACGLVPKAQAAELVLRFEKRRGNHAVLGSSFFDRRSRRCRFGIWRIAGASAGIAKILFFIFLVLLLVSLVTHFTRGSRIP